MMIRGLEDVIVILGKQQKRIEELEKTIKTLQKNEDTK